LERRISCRACGNNEVGTFSLKALVMMISDQNSDGVWGEFETTATTRQRWLSCNECGHTWPTTRSLDAHDGLW
jgi:hypothetical protein